MPYFEKIEALALPDGMFPELFSSPGLQKIPQLHHWQSTLIESLETYRLTQ